MDVQHKLSSYYDQSLEVAVNHLTSKHKAMEIQVSSDKAFITSYPKTFLIKDSEENGNLEIIISIPYNFPDSFPKVSIPEPLFSEVYPIPHLDSLKTLCTFDENVAHPNAEDPKGVLDEVIIKAFDIIKTGMSGQNPFDYVDEFDSYWVQEAEEEILSLLSVSSKSREVHLLTFVHPHWDSTKLVTDSRLEGEKWLTQAGAKMSMERKKAFYLPLSSIGVPPFPKTNGELIKRLKEVSSEYVKPLLTYLNSNRRPTMIVISVLNGEDRIFAAWEHPPTRQVKTTPFIGKRKIQESLDGFRPTKRNALLELQRDFKYLRVKKLKVTRVDKSRLHSRGGDGELKTSHRIGVLGCGSIGSHIITSIVDSGVDNLLLIDKEKLTFENIARHTSGAYLVGLPKVTGISHTLKLKFPHIQVTTYTEEILKALRDYESLLNGTDFSIVALGDFPTESRLNHLQQEGVITKPLLYVWVEPYLTGGHAVYINPSYLGCFRCLFDDNHIYRRNVLANPEIYSRRESGCQSTYVPYNVTEVKRFISDMSFFIDDIRSGQVKENTVFTWIGNLSLQKSNGRRISSRWTLANDYSIRRIPVTEFQVCEVCKG